MRVLFLTSPAQDILEDSLLHGLRSLLGEDCVDYPRKDALYRDYQVPSGDRPYGNLSTLWRTLADLPVDRSDVEMRIRATEFDLIIIGSIHRALERHRHLIDALPRSRTIAIDGEDFRGVAVQALRFLYFKRELDWKAGIVWHGARLKRVRIPVPTRLLKIEPISFSIPAEKIRDPVPAAGRTRAFSQHIVDSEVRDLLEKQGRISRATPDARGYVHSTELTYYDDLSGSVFGITTKRGGWDCLRHYEIGANGAIICFRDLDLKPSRCAPMGLDGTNTIVYQGAVNLLSKLERLSMTEQDRLIMASHRWVTGQTTERRARYLLDVARRRLG
jgi:hypothetical protein